MCGIHGIVALQSGYQPAPELARSMASVTWHRGPDDEGLYTGNGVVLGMRRLSIIDVEHGHQPIANEDETIWVVCNGEIYNYRELRSRLIKQGHIFRTGSDTEVLVHLYEEYGERFVEYLDGMFGFALWDKHRRCMLLGRDRLGIKPVYYYTDPRRLVFSSEAKAILTVPGVQREMDPVGLSQYLHLGYVPTPYSMFSGVRKLPPASLMVVENGGVGIKRYWKIAPEIDKSLNDQQWAELLLDAMDNAVSKQMVSDVPLGAFLSGGIDSSSIVGLMAKQSSEPIRTYSIGFTSGTEGQFYNELPYARQVAKLFKTEHKEIVVDPDVIELLPRLLWHLDEPVADTAFITTFLVSKFAREDVTVILSGVGGDELFGGYRRYLGEYYQRYYRLIPGWLHHMVIRPLICGLPVDRHSPMLNLARYARSFIRSSDLSFEERYRSYVNVFSRASLKELVKGGQEPSLDALELAFREAYVGSDPIRSLSHVDMLTQLPDDLLMLTDKMTMAASVECRVPLLDHNLVEIAARMPTRLKIRGRELKYVMKRALRQMLPDTILDRKKRGFGAPMGAWLKRELEPVMMNILSRDAVENRGILNWHVVQDTMERHRSNKEDHTDHLLALMNLELWCCLYLDGRSPEELSCALKDGVAV